MVSIFVLAALFGIVGRFTDAAEQCDSTTGPLRCCYGGSLSEITNAGLVPVQVCNNAVGPFPVLGQCGSVRDEPTLGDCQPVPCSDPGSGSTGVLGLKDAFPTGCNLKLYNWREAKSNNATRRGVPVDEELAICEAIFYLLGMDDCESDAAAKTIQSLQIAGVDASCCNGTICCGNANSACLKDCTNPKSTDFHCLPKTCELLTCSK